MHKSTSSRRFTKARLAKFLSYYRPHRKIFIMDMFFAALSATTVLLFPPVSGYITDTVLTSASPDTSKKLILCALMLLLLTLVKVVSNIIYAAYGHAMGAQMEQTMREELFAHYEHLSFGFHARNSTGKLMTVISNDLTSMTELFHHAPEDLLMTLIKFVGAFVIMLTLSPLLTLIVFAFLPVLGIAAYFTDRFMERQLLISKELLGEMNDHLEDSLSGIRTVKAFGNEKKHLNAFRRKNTAYTGAKCLFYKVEALFYETVESYPQFLTMLVVIFGALMVGKGNVRISVLVTFLLYSGSLAEPIRTMLNFMRLYEEGKAGFIRFMDLIETDPVIKEDPHPVQAAHLDGTIRFDHVSFHYEDAREDVLKDIDLTISAGQTVAFAGASGIGKTTLSALVARFYDPTEGRILIDGIDLKKLSLTALRSNVGIVQQEVYIFNGTIRDNIAYGWPEEKPPATDEMIERAAKRANIHDFIMTLENGYDSLVGTKGILLSGGQRQRISLARLFLKDPAILILDEATSALDYESERIVQESMEELMKGRTSIVIAHRLSTIKNADCIYVLDDKHIVEAGTHEQLLAENGEYAKLCRLGNR